MTLSQLVVDDAVTYSDVLSLLLEDVQLHPIDLHLWRI